MSNILKAESLCKKYPLPKGILKVFENLNFELDKGKLIAIMGVSGVGKTTLLNLFGALDRPTEGKISVTWSSSTAPARAVPTVNTAGGFAAQSPSRMRDTSRKPTPTPALPFFSET